MTYGSDKIMWRGVYGYVQRTALNHYNAGIAKSKAAYYSRPLDEESPLPRRTRRWSTRDVRKLKRMRKEGVEYTVIARRLQRSVSATQAKADKLGITNKRRTK